MKYIRLSILSDSYVSYALKRSQILFKVDNKYKGNTNVKEEPFEIAYRYQNKRYVMT